MMPYITEALIGGAEISLGDLPFFETVDGVAVEPAGEIVEADQADQYKGSAGAWFTKFALTYRFTIPRFTAQVLAAALNLTVETRPNTAEEVDLNPPAYVPQWTFRMLATRADNVRVLYECPAVIIIPPSGQHTIGRNTPAGVAMMIKTCVNPNNTASQGKITFERVPVTP